MTHDKRRRGPAVTAMTYRQFQANHVLAAVVGLTVLLTTRGGAQSAPIAKLESASDYRRATFGCDGCSYATLSYSTPPYRTLDQDRSITLVYSSAASAPMISVSVDVTNNGWPQPDRLSLGLLAANGALQPLVTGGTEVFYAAAPGTNRLTAQIAATNLSTGWYSQKALVHAWFGGQPPYETQLAVKGAVLNDRHSDFGSGWSVAGMPRLALPLGTNGDALLIDGGNLLRYPSCGSGCWTPPPGESSTFGWAPGGQQYQRGFRDGSVILFEPSHNLVTVMRDRLGNQTTYDYDGYWRLARITDPAGFATTISYSAPPGSAGTVTITTPGGRASSLRIDGAGQLIDITDPDNVRALAVTYSNDRITDATDRLSGVTSFGYDAYGSLASVTGPSVLVNGSYARAVTTIRSREIALLPMPGLGSSGNPGSSVMADSVWSSVRSQRGDSARVQANGAGDAIVVVSASSAGKALRTTIDRDSTSRVRSVYRPGAVNVVYRWSGDFLTTVRDLVAGDSTTYTYNSLGQPLTVGHTGSIVQQNFYSADARSVLDSTMAGSSVTRFTYSTRGQPLSVTDPSGHQTVVSYGTGVYDNVFLNASSVTAHGATTRFSYDNFGRQTTVTNPAGQTASVAYDIVNRVTQTVGFESQAISTWNYDDTNRSYTFKDAKQQEYRTILNTAGAVTRQVDPLQASDSSTYDIDGNVSSVITRGGRTVQFTRDATGRPLTVHPVNGSDITFAYDTAGTWSAFSNAESRDSVFLDGSGRLSRQTTVRNGVTYSLTTQYNTKGQKSYLVIAVPGQTSSVREYLSDSLGRPSFISDFGSNRTGVTYNADHQPATLTFPSGRQQTNTIGANDQLATVSGGGAAALDWSYSYDILDRLIQLSQGTSPGRHADYDAAGRLAHWTDSREVRGPRQKTCTDPYDLSTCYFYYPVDTQVVREQYLTHDLVGNRTDLGASVQTGNRLVAFNGYTMNYDADGNLLNKSGNGLTQSFTWNDFGQLISVTTNGTVTSFGYDGAGRRVRKTYRGPSTFWVDVNTYYVYDGDDLVLQLDGNGQRQLEFSYYPGVDNPHAVKVSATGAVYYYSTSQPGHVTALVDQSNAVVNQYAYTPFGESISKSEQVAQPFQFAGRQLDSETGLYYNRARYYDPTLARFISEDPIGLAGGVNQYAYASDDPINMTDPSGLLECRRLSDGGLICRVGPPVTLPPIVVNGGKPDAPFSLANWGISNRNPFGSGSYGSMFIRPEDMQPRRNPDGDLIVSRAAQKSADVSRACTEASGVSSSSANPYDKSASYLGISAREMFEFGGDGPWGSIVRSCLKCAFAQANPPTMSQAHSQCYGAASGRVGLTAMSFGYARAVSAAILINYGQISVQTAWPGRGLLGW